MSKSSLLGHGYSKVAHLLGRRTTDPKKQNFPVLDDHPVGQEFAQQGVETFDTVHMNTRQFKKEFRIYRRNPDNPNNKPYIQSYFVDLSNCGPMVLDVLQKIKAEEDSSLTYRRFIEPWLKTTKKPEDGREYRQSPADRKKPDGLYECILCACCTTSCPSHWWNPEEFLGPAALLQAYRWICDSRGEFGEARLVALTEDEKSLYRCRTIKNCTATCPRSLDPAGAIHKLKAIHLLYLPEEKVENK